MEYIAFNAHKHDTLASVAKPDGELVPEERIEPHNGWHRVLPSRSAASPGPRLPVDDLFERHHAAHLTSEGDFDVSSTGRHEIEDVDDFPIKVLLSGTRYAAPSARDPDLIARGLLEGYMTTPSNSAPHPWLLIFSPRRSSQQNRERAPKALLLREFSTTAPHQESGTPLES